MKTSILVKSSTSFTGIVLTPAFSPEVISLDTVGKEPGDVRLSGSKGLLSLGPQNKFSTEMIRRAGGTLSKWLAANNVAEIGIDISPLLATGMAPSNAIPALVEGLLLGSFNFDGYKSTREEKSCCVNFLFEDKTIFNLTEIQNYIEKAAIISEAVNLSREWAHEPPNVINPVTLVERVKKIASEVGLKCTVLDDKQLSEMGAGSIVAVGKGSNTPSRLIILEHTGSGKGKPVALVGKSLTMDTGGYSLKTTDGIVSMKYDKSGGMTVIASLVAAARLKLNTNVIGVIAAAENMISSSAYRPDDILKALNGKTIEVISTDAEGRLVLADALTYTEKTFQPRSIIDIATLTGAVVIALGSVRAGLLSNNGDLAASIYQAGEKLCFL
ncbi:MAG: M17 family peptidase N-terminal domain-containing protein [Chloroflexota bacterium]